MDLFLAMEMAAIFAPLSSEVVAVAVAVTIRPGTCHEQLSAP